MVLQWINALNHPFFNLLHTISAPSFCCFFKNGLLLGNYVHLSEWKGCSQMSLTHCSRIKVHLRQLFLKCERTCCPPSVTMRTCLIP